MTNNGDIVNQASCVPEICKEYIVTVNKPDRHFLRGLAGGVPLTPEEQIKTCGNRLRITVTDIIIRIIRRYPITSLTMLMQQLKKLEKEHPELVTKGFSDTACRRHGKADCRSA